MIKIGLLCKSESLLEKLVSLYRFNSSIQLIGLKSNAIEEIKKVHPDLLIFEFNDETNTLLDDFEQLKLQLRIPGICVLEKMSMENIATILEHQIQYYTSFETSALEYYVLILRMVSENKELSLSSEQKTENLLEDQGFLRHLKGYAYLKTILIYCIEKQDSSIVMKECYEIAALRHQTTASRVEKSLRKVIKDSRSLQNQPHLSNAAMIVTLVQQLERK